MFSQTGSEIANIAEKINRWPDLIIVNERNIERTIDSRLQGKNVVFTSNTPSVEELGLLWLPYRSPVITLHGWLRIIPPDLCQRYNIYNGHPGLITEYPELKGKDPQIRAIQGDYTKAGCVIHKVTAGVDEGKVLRRKSFSIDGLEERECFRIFSETSLILWVQWLTKMFIPIPQSPHERGRI
jgi:folate-dependent phosphoribosylglycinamide formyltransferase PurN